MQLTEREIRGLIHGIGLGSNYLLAYYAGWAWLRTYSPELATETGLKVRHARMVPRVWLLSAVCWLTCLTGLFVVYPWYRAIPPEGANLQDYPQAMLLKTGKQRDGTLSEWSGKSTLPGSPRSFRQWWQRLPRCTVAVWPGTQ